MSSSSLKEYMKTSPPFRSGGRGTKQLTAALKSSADRQVSPDGASSEEKYAFFLGRSSPCFVKIVQDNHGGSVLVQPLRPNPLEKRFLVPWEGHLWSAMRSKLLPVEMRIRMEGLEAYNPPPYIRSYLSSFQGAGKVFEYPQNSNQQQQAADSYDTNTYDDHAFPDDTDVVSIDSGDSNSKKETEVLDSHPLSVTTKKSLSSTILSIAIAATSATTAADQQNEADNTVAADALLMSPAPTYVPLHNKPAVSTSMIPAAYQSEWDELRSNVLALTSSSAASSSAGNTPLMLVNGMSSPAGADGSDNEGFILSYINSVLKGQLKQKQEVDASLSPSDVLPVDQQSTEEEKAVTKVEDQQVSTPITLAKTTEEDEHLTLMESDDGNIPATISTAEDGVFDAAHTSVEGIIMEAEEALSSDSRFEDHNDENFATADKEVKQAYDPFAIFRRDEEDDTIMEDTQAMDTNNADLATAPVESQTAVVVPLTVLQQQYEQYKASLQTSIVETSRSKPPLHPHTKKTAKRRREVVTDNAAIIGEPRAKRVAIIQQGQSAIAKRDGCLGSWPSRKQSAAKGDWKI